MIRTLSLLFLVSTFLGVGCAAGYVAPGEKLRRSVFSYNDAVRWQRYEAAAEHLPPERRQSYLQTQRDAGDSLRILEYELLEVQHNEEDKKALVTVKFRWTRMPSNRVETTTIRQTWSYGEDRQWAMTEKEEVEDEPGEPIPFEDRF
jgi:hypothetical protein